MINQCENCPLNLETYKERKLGLKKSKKSNDIVIDGAVGTDFVYYKENLLKELPEAYRCLGKYFSMDVYKKDMPKKIHFSGFARLTFDGFLSDEDYKSVSEEKLLNYEYKGYIYLVGIDYSEKEWMYGVAGDFNGDLPSLLVNSVRIRLSPIESSI